MNNLLLKPVLVLMLVSLCVPASSHSGERLTWILPAWSVDRCVRRWLL